MKKGSISVSIIVMVLLVIIVSSIIFEYGFYKFNISKQTAFLYLELDKNLSEFNRKLFNEYALLGTHKKINEGYSDPLSDKEVLFKQIVTHMKIKQFSKTYYKAEDIVNNIIKSKTNKAKVFDISALNHELLRIINSVKDKNIRAKVDVFIKKLVPVMLYVELRGLSFSSLKKMLINLEFEKIKEISPVFVVKQKYRRYFHDYQKALVKFDVLGAYNHYLLADYSIDYLGHSVTRDSKLRAEYVATGIKNNVARNFLIRGELFLLRLLINVSECFINPKIMDRLNTLSFKNPKLFVLLAIIISGAESVIDVIKLFDKKKVPLYKGRRGFTSLNFRKTNYPKGYKYEDYLKALLMVWPRSIVLKRIAYVIEKNHKIKLKEFFTKTKIKREIKYKPFVLPFKFKRIIEGELSYEKQNE